MTISTTPRGLAVALANLGLSMSPEDLASLAEIAKMLGVTKRTAQRYITRPDFPEPLGRLATGRIWAKADIEAWGAQHLPLPRSGRPRKAQS